MAKDDDSSESEALATTKTEIVDPFEIIKNPLADPETEDKVHKAIERIVMLDGRLTPDPEILDAIKDWIRVEIILDKLYKDFEDVEHITSAKGRLFRDLLNQKNICRDVIWGKTLDQKGRKRVVVEAEVVLQEEGIIEAKVPVDVID